MALAVEVDLPEVGLGVAVEHPRLRITKPVTVPVRDFRSSARPRLSSSTPKFGYSATTENVVVASGAKPFEQFFCEAFLDPGDAVLVFSPHFPTYVPNIERRGAGRCWCRFKVENAVPAPAPRTSSSFLANDPKPRAIFLNSPHNPTGGVATGEDLAAIADLVRGHRHGGLLRRAVLPHGLGRPARTRSWPSRACSTRPWRPTPSASRTA